MTLLIHVCKHSVYTFNTICQIRFVYLLLNNKGTIDLSLFWSICFLQLSTFYFGRGSRETRDLTSFQKDLRLDRHQSFVKLFTPMVVGDTVLSSLLLCSLFIPSILCPSLQCRGHAERVCRVCSDSFLLKGLEKLLKCLGFLCPVAQFGGSFKYLPGAFHPEQYPALHCEYIHTEVWEQFLEFFILSRSIYTCCYMDWNKKTPNLIVLW